MCRLILTAGLCLIIATLASGASQFCIGKSNGDYANVNNPNSYYTCSGGLTYVRSCPSGLIFRQSCNCCDWPTTPSPTTTTKAPTKTTSAGPIDQFCKGRLDGDYANPKNPSTFYSCSNGFTYLMKCQTGLVFSQSCDCCQ
ncbi:Chitotriosidase-1 [Channa argus]|uniref:chitinase n=1 Tax=Channa argus TaxID=215402 RepID=A0A6G1PU37_CHAAH|nr:Chitotriosidase-1 [Channa argus]KAF3693506.1 Chitotriosidase-1 [Channa argus]